MVNSRRSDGRLKRPSILEDELQSFELKGRTRKSDKEISKQLSRLGIENENTESIEKLVQRVSTVFDNLDNEFGSKLNKNRSSKELIDSALRYEIQKKTNENKKKKEELSISRNGILDFFLMNAANADGLLTDAEKLRIEDYTLYDQIYTYISEMGDAADVVADSVLSPDIYGGNSFFYKLISFHEKTSSNNANDSTSKENSKATKRNIFTEDDARLKVDSLLEHFNLVEEMRDIILSTVVSGDAFYVVISQAKEIADIYNHLVDTNQIKKNDKEPKILSSTHTKELSKLFESTVQVIDENIIEESYEIMAQNVLDGVFSFESLLKTSIMDTEDSETSEVYLSEYRDILKNYDEELANSSKKSIKERILDKKRSSKNAMHKKNSKSDISDIMVKKVNPKNMIAVKINNMVTGYYYINFEEEAVRKNSSTNLGNNYNGTVNAGNSNSSYSNSTITTGSSNRTSTFAINNDFSSYLQFINNSLHNNQTTKDGKGSGFDFNVLTKSVLKFLSEKLNMNSLKRNPELKNLIYNLVSDKRFLKKKVNVSFIPAELVVHFKTTTDTYGKSIYAKSAFFAKLYLSVLMSGVLKKLGAQDQRIFYLESAMDSDVEGSVMQFARDAKQKNVAPYNSGDITTIIRNTTPYKDMVVPVINGKRPVEFDMIQAPDSSIDDDFLDKLRKSMISGTGVPEAFLGLRNEVDFAKGLAMSNSSFVKMVVRNQNTIANAYTKLLNILIMIAYPELSITVKAEFTPPVSLNLDNMNSALSSASNFADSLSQTMIPVEIGDEELQKFTNMLKFEILKEQLPQVKWDVYEKILEDTRIKFLQEKLRTGANGGSGTNNFGNIYGGESGGNQDGNDPNQGTTVEVMNDPNNPTVVQDQGKEDFEDIGDQL